MAIGVLAVVFNIIELTCYIISFGYLIYHDNTIAISVLTQDVINQRNKRNAITMVGQLVTWIVEILYVVLQFIFALKGNMGEMREIASIIKTLDFFLIPLVQIVTSPPLKRFLLKNKTD